MTTSQDFDGLLDEFLADEMAASPTTATALGVQGYDDQLPDLTAAGFAAREATDDRWTERLAAVDPAALTAEQRIDRDLVRMTLRRRAILREWTNWRRSPDTYTGPVLYGVFAAFMNRLRPEPELVADTAARLAQVPDQLAAGRANLDPELASPLLVRRALGQARGAVSYFRDDLPADAEEGSGRTRLAAAGEVAAARLRRVRRLPRGPGRAGHRRLGDRRAALQRAAARGGGARLRRPRAPRPRPGGVRRAGRGHAAAFRRDLR